MAGLRLLLVDDFGHVRTLSDNVYVGPEQPINPDVLVWVDTITNPPTVKYLIDGQYCSPAGTGVEFVSSLTNIPTTAKLIVANISSDQSLSIGDMLPGQEIHIIVTGEGNIAIPSDDDYINFSEDMLTVDGKSEINIISDGVKKYIRTV